MNKPRILFLLKKRPVGEYGTWSYSEGEGKGFLPSGLSVSTGEMGKMLNSLGIENSIVQCVDNNDIDREVTKFKPTHVFIEAFWVVPEKFDILKKLHPHVKWLVRNHSKLDFLSHEGSVNSWVYGYLTRGVYLACNSKEATEDYRRMAKSTGLDPHLVVYLPNYYESEVFENVTQTDFVQWHVRTMLGCRPRSEDMRSVINVGCFGAVRPLKNHFNQAFAAITLANELGVKLKFHINGTRIEGKAHSILVAIRKLFEQFPKHELIEIPWQSHEDFKSTLMDMDVVMQVSNSETFNIVAADAVSVGTPVIGSDELPWLPTKYHADPNNVQSIIRELEFALEDLNTPYITQHQTKALKQYTNETKELWISFIMSHLI